MRKPPSDSYLTSVTVLPGIESQHVSHVYVVVISWAKKTITPHCAGTVGKNLKQHLYSPHSPL